MKPRDYQLPIIEKGASIINRYGVLRLHMQMRTGKTFTSYFIIEKMKFKRCLFIGTVKSCQGAADDYNAGKWSFSLAIINLESIHKIKENDFDIVIIDEAHRLGAFPKPGVRTKQVKELVYEKRIIYLTGTPSPESYSQLFHQMWVSIFSPWCEYENFYKWVKAGYVFPKDKWTPHGIKKDYKEANVTKIWEDIKPISISLSQEEAGFKAKVIEHFIECPMSFQLHYMKESIEKDSITWFMKDNQIVEVICESATDLINKLSQLSGGTIKVGEERYIIDRSKAFFIKQQFHGQKIAIYYRFIAEGDLLKSIFTNWTDDFNQFNQSFDKTFICQIQSGREGVSLRTADAMVMYNIDFSATSYYQLRDRMQDSRRSEDSNIYWIISDMQFELEVYKAVCKKKDFTASYYKRSLKNIIKVKENA